MRVTDCTPGSSAVGNVGAALLLVIVVDAADERRDQRHAGFGAGHRLREAEEQRQVAVDALAFELLGGADALPGAADLDQDPLAANARGSRRGRSARAPWRWCASVSKLSRASTSVDTRPGTIFRISLAEIDGQPIHERFGLARRRPRRDDRRPVSAASTSGRYCGCCAAFNSSDGLVVASCG